jgi:hypothetical protein
METTHPSGWATAGRVLLGLAVTAAAGLHTLLWLFIAAFQCDESCDGGSWHGTPGAWQWSALGLLGIASLVLAVAFAVAFAARRSTRLWGTLLAAAVAAAIAPWLLMAA